MCTNLIFDSCSQFSKNSKKVFSFFGIFRGRFMIGEISVTVKSQGQTAYAVGIFAAMRTSLLVIIKDADIVGIFIVNLHKSFYPDQGFRCRCCCCNSICGD